MPAAHATRLVEYRAIPTRRLPEAPAETWRALVRGGRAFLQFLVINAIRTYDEDSRVADQPSHRPPRRRTLRTGTAPDRATALPGGGASAQGPARRWYPSKARGCGASRPRHGTCERTRNFFASCLVTIEEEKPLTENFPPPHPRLSGKEKKSQLFIERSKLPKFLVACFISHQQFSRPQKQPSSCLDSNSSPAILAMALAMLI